MTSDEHKNLDDLEEKLCHVESRTASSVDKTEKKLQGDDQSDSRAGVQAGFELVAAIGAGIAAGIGLDHWLGAKPLFFILMFFLGICTGFYNVYRITSGSGSAVGFSRLHKKKKDAKTSPE